MKRPGILLLATFLAVHLNGLAFGQSRTTMEQVLASWKHRQEKVTSARFVCEEEITYPKGVTSRSLAADPAMKTRPGAVYPPQDHKYLTPLYLSLDGDKMRFDCRQLDWRETIREFTHVYAFDGKSGKIIHQQRDGRAEGSVRTEKHNRHAANFHVRALLMAYRPLHPGISPQGGAEYELTGRSDVVGGRNCLEVSYADPGGATTRLWVDPTRDFLPALIVRTTGKTDIARLNVEYQQQPDVGWVPSAWSLVIRTPTGWLSETSRTKVKCHEFNVAIPHNVFDPEFPVGTFVQNLRTGASYIQE